MQKLIFTACAALLLTAQTAPPSSDPVMAHYRAYRSAIVAGDMSAAETEVVSALEASIARDQSGGRTGVLALTLATTRLANQRTAEAYAPALQAFEIAQSNSASGLDPLLTRFVLGRAELTPAHEATGRARLLAVIAETANQPAMAAEAYDAALALGRWDIAHEEYEEAATAWAYAAQFASAAEGDTALALGEARTAEGVAWLSRAAQLENEQPRRGTGSHLQNLEYRELYQRAAAAMLQAVTVLRPLAHVESAGDELTIAQRDFAQASAWRLLIRARLRSTGQEPLDEGNLDAPQSGPIVLAPLCKMVTTPEPRPTYPRVALGQGTFGVVILRLLLDQNGQVTDVRAAAAVPDQWFQEAVERVASQWRVVRAPDAEPNCRTPHIMFYTVTFTFQ